MMIDLGQALDLWFILYGFTIGLQVALLLWYGMQEGDARG